MRSMYNKLFYILFIFVTSIGISVGQGGSDKLLVGCPNPDDPNDPLAYLLDVK